MDEDFSKYNAEGSLLRRAQLRMLDILIEIDKICNRHNISYWLDFGTLLGAVRHKGFIPWDDDLDIGVLRKDYMKLLTVLEKELPQQFFVQNESNERYYPYQWSKVVDKKSRIEEIENIPIENKGLFIDIFPLEHGSLFIKRVVDFFYGRTSRRLRVFGAQNSGISKSEFLISQVTWPFVVLAVFIIRLLCKVFYSDKVVYGYGIGFIKEHKISSIFPLKEIIFEGKKFPSPNHHDNYLIDIYGNYMEIPPENKRAIHFHGVKFFD